MFDPRPDIRPACIEVFVDGVAVRVPKGASAAAAVLLSAASAIRTTAVSGARRLPYCMMGVCFDCLAVIDGVQNRQSCMIAAVAGMRIDRQDGARRVEL